MSAAPVLAGRRDDTLAPGPALPDPTSPAPAATAQGCRNARRECAITALGAPSLRIIRVSARVSTPDMPILPWLAIQSANVCARKLECGVTSSRTMQPSAPRRPALHVFLVRADVADMREGEADDLAVVGGIGHHFLITCHRGVEADFANRRSRRAEAPAPQHRAIGQNTRTPVAPSGCAGVVAGRAICGHSVQGFFR